jgi:very-short-patch-repair endonuclease
VRRRPSGTQYLDADFPAYGVSVEIDGAQHDLPAHRLADLLRDLGLAAEGRTTVRIPLVAWRLDQEAVLDGLERLFQARGWRRAAA